MSEYATVVSHVVCHLHHDPSLDGKVISGGEGRRTTPDRSPDWVPGMHEESKTSPLEFGHISDYLWSSDSAINLPAVTWWSQITGNGRQRSTN